MGAVFWVEMKITFNDEERATEALKSYVHGFLAKNPQCRYRGTGESFDELLGFVLADHQNNFHHKHAKRSKIHWYSSGFDASYGWSWVIDEAFSAIAPYLANGSTYYQSCENDWDKIKVIDGKAIWYRGNDR